MSWSSRPCPRGARLRPPTALAAPVALLFLGPPPAPVGAQLPRVEEPAPANRILSHREQDALVRSRIQERFETVLPDLMRETGIDMWIVVSREYNDDPVFRSMAPLTTYSSRRRTILVFHDRGEGAGVDRISVGRFDYDGLFEVYRTHNDSQYVGLRRLVEERAPRRIGIDVSDAWNHADGLTHSEYLRLTEALGPMAERVTSAEELAVAWLERKLPSETKLYRYVMRVAHQVIAEAFSNAVIVPGTTTDVDVEWWMRQRVAEMGLGQWFHPSINIQRRGGLPDPAPPHGTVIERGDMLHTDFGIVMLGYATDTQHNAYVLRPGETGAPEGLEAGLRAANRLQDLTMEHARIGATGNEALAAALRQARAEGMNPSIYCHAIGYHGHAAGPPIGMTDYQNGVPVRGDRAFANDTWHSIELNVRQAVPEWGGQEVRFALEEDAALLAGRWDWIDGRQTGFYLIR
ncbi:MAG TPA: M24 family metallopeptidase [Longimicrobiales bacterium]|nr:M24 family metallopeptidase [Longimicrobiales bacterium]